MRQLQGMDSFFVALETSNSPMHIGSILIYDPATAPGGKVRFKDIIRFFEGRLQLSKTVRQRLVRVPFELDYAYWVEDAEFNLEYHLRHIALPKPGDWRQLCIQASRIFARPLDLTRPPWEFTVIEGLRDIPGIAPGSFAIVTKVHHAAMDGLSGIDLMAAIHTLTPTTAAPNTPDLWEPEPVPRPLELLGRSIVAGLRNRLRRAEVTARALPALANVVQGLQGKEFSLDRDLLPPRTRFNAPISAHRVVDARRFALADVRAIRKLQPGAKSNDVYLTVVGGAMRKYLAAKGELPDLTLTALVPISVRSREEKSDMGNQLAAMLVQLGTDRDDPAERLRYVHSKAVNSKALTAALGARMMSDISKVGPAMMIALVAQLYTRLGLADRIAPLFSTLVTNVPGPRAALYSAGAKLQTMVGMICLTDGIGLSHVIQSYGGEATIAFTADRDLMPDPEFYAQCIGDSFAELLAAAKAADVPLPAVKATRRPRSSPKDSGTGTKPAAGGSTLAARRSSNAKPRA